MPLLNNSTRGPWPVIELAEEALREEARNLLIWPDDWKCNA